MTTLTPKQAMLMAIEEARKGAGFVSPNPLVGCVIVDRDHQLLSCGHHARAGQAHAEVNALAAVGKPESLQGAHVYVTLEPCAHQGRTPSCAKALAQLPIRSVTYGLVDPNPLVSGKGAEILRQAGKSVVHFTELHEELEDLAEIFLLNMRSQRPFVGLKIATSLDGKIALENGVSQWITGSEARQEVQSLRGAYDAVLIGANTFLQDNPSLNSRDPRFAQKPQKAVLFDPKGRCLSRLAESKLLQVRRREDLYYVSGPGQSALEGAHHLSTSAPEFVLSEVLAWLYSQGIRSLLVEGGGLTFSGFVQQNLVDRIFLFVAPKIIGRGISWAESLRLDDLQKARLFHRLKTTQFGNDVLLSGSTRPTTKT
jgi:diaminohydroxyphosphoribosylaminopyrimidine deaminase/5-amino-6-(5-phosphoribosylamino)uracil reductase